VSDYPDWLERQLDLSARAWVCGYLALERPRIPSVAEMMQAAWRAGYDQRADED
jgi:hypothetical protein